MNKVHAELAKRGIKVLKDPFAKKRRPLLKELGSRTIDECLTIIETLDKRILEVSRELQLRAKENEDGGC